MNGKQAQEKRSSTSLVTTKIQQNSVRYQYILIKMSKNKKLIIPSTGEDVEHLEHPYIADGNAK